jgi:radical SAM superfamily enzyme YgiQ (UPF0313 family)
MSKLLQPVLLLITPPLTQLNTPYPATSYLKGFLKTKDIKSFQADLGIELMLALFSKKALMEMFQQASRSKKKLSKNSFRILCFQNQYIQTIDVVIKFLQGKDPTLAFIISNRNFLPEASRFEQLNDLEWNFGSMGIQDKAKYLATLYIEDIGDLIIDAINPNFGFSRYAEKIAITATQFDSIDNALKAKTNYTDKILLELLDYHLQKVKPDIVGFSVPFPGNLYGALKCGQHVKQNYPNIKVVMGGGYPNTELRSLSDPAVFNYVDFITLDDGESPLLKIIEFVSGKRRIDELQRTYTLNKSKVVFHNRCLEKDIPHSKSGTPDYSDLPLQQYLSTIDMLNPMHRLWSDGRWNKLTIAHGCYWKKCSFCDISLDYIKRYDQASTDILANRIEEIILQTGQTGFHFVDEAAPPVALKNLAFELIKRELKISWWTNIRFEKTFTPELCDLLAKSGCIAVTGGLEVASDRLLNLMEKGVTIEQVTRVTQAFTNANIMVHAYLMYGFPTQTENETIDSLEVVRQLFENNLLQSAFWHRFTMTAHSPVGKNPEKYQVKKTGPRKGSFANNDLFHEDRTGCDHELFGEGLNKALYNYMHGLGFELPLQKWFSFKVPKTTLSKKLIAGYLQ